MTSSLYYNETQFNAELEGIVVERRVGAGSNGAVLLCRLKSTGEEVALKVASHFWSEDAKRVLDYERKVLEALPPHENIVRIRSQFVSRI